MNFFDFSFWQNFVSNGLATLIGVILGIPAALWINRILETGSAKEHKKKVLVLLKDELESNHGFYKEWEASEPGLERTELLITMVRDDNWKSVAAAGEIVWLKDPELLQFLTDAYYPIEVIRQISYLYIDSMVAPYTTLQKKRLLFFEKRLDEMVDMAKFLTRDCLNNLKKYEGFTDIDLD